MSETNGMERWPSSAPLPTIATCQRCGRGFVTISTPPPWTDAYLFRGEICGGNIGLNDLGRAKAPPPQQEAE